MGDLVEIIHHPRGIEFDADKWAQRLASPLYREEHERYRAREARPVTVVEMALGNALVLAELASVLLDDAGRKELGKRLAVLSQSLNVAGVQQAAREVVELNRNVLGAPYRQREPRFSA